MSFKTLIVFCMFAFTPLAAVNAEAGDDAIIAEMKRLNVPGAAIAALHPPKTYADWLGHLKAGTPVMAFVFENDGLDT
jgi:hypothetical protein